MTERPRQPTAIASSPSASQLSSTNHRSCASTSSMTVSRSNGHAERVGQHDRPGPRRDGRPQLLRIGVVVAQPDVDEDRHQAVLDDRRDRAREAGGDRDDLVAGLEPAIAELRRGERRQRDEVRRRARVDEQGVGQAEVVGEAGLELLGVAAGRQVEVEARVDQEPHLLLAEHAAGVADRVAVGIERPRRVALAVVAAHQLEDLVARVGRVVAPRRHVVDLSPSSRAHGRPAARASSW